jgi:hypothetical protein
LELGYRKHDASDRREVLYSIVIDCGATLKPVKHVWTGTEMRRIFRYKSVK